MKFKASLMILIAALATGCSLAEDVTPPPALATQQAVQVPLQPTGDRPQPSSVEVVSPPSPPDPEAGGVIYADRCAPCHGPAGLGQGSMTANLEIPPTMLGDADIASVASPTSWYEVVTEGRMDRFMPPFSSLNDQQRWDVVAYALTLSTDPEQIAQGEQLYFEACSKCHGDDGKGVGGAPDLTSPDFFAGHTIESVRAAIRTGAEGMPAYEDVFDAQQQTALASYVRSFAWAPASGLVALPTSDATTESGKEEPTAAVLGSIKGQVTNGSEGGVVPAGLDVAIVGFDGDAPVFNQSVPVDLEGRYLLEGVEIVAGRIYGAIVEYEGVPYYSTAGHILAEAPNLELPLTIFESTPDLDGIRIDRLHLIFDFSVEGVLDVSQLWLISNTGDRTVADPNGQNAIPVNLPPGFTNLQFSDPAAQELYTPTGDGFIMHEPISPDTPVELIFSFNLPYKNKLEYEQDMTLPVDAVVVLAEQTAPELSGDQLVATGEQTMGALSLRTYAMAGLQVGGTLSISISGRPSAEGSGSPNTNLIIGIGALALALIVTGLGWRQMRRNESGERDAEVDEPVGTGMDRNQLLHAIAGLDNAYERGAIDEASYQDRRTRLKAELASLIKSHDD